MTTPIPDPEPTPEPVPTDPTEPTDPETPPGGLPEQPDPGEDEEPQPDRCPVLYRDRADVRCELHVGHENRMPHRNMTVPPNFEWE
ncbi:hypothetical protein ACWZEH_12955 [Streptomyces sp. QTS137]